MLELATQTEVTGQLELMEKAPWKHIILILAIVMAIVIGVFVMWLHVRFPEGVLFEMLL